MQTEHSPFPTDETLAAYIDGRLDEETRKRVVEHMAKCEECFETVIAARELTSQSTDVAGTNAAPFRRRRFLTTFAAAAAALLCAVIVIVARRTSHEPLGTIARLNAAAPRYRPVPGRLNAFEYHPLPPVTRGSDDSTEPKTDIWRVMSLAYDLNAEAQRTPTVENLHALGVAYVLTGEWNSAVAKLESAIERETGEDDAVKAIEKSKNVALLNDLSVANLAKAKHTNDSTRIATALESAERAWSLAQTPDVAWNRALAWEAMHVNGRALNAWRDYLRLDSTSAWSSEAATHLAKLEKPPQSSEWLRVRPSLEHAARHGQRAAVRSLISSYPLESRTLAEDELFTAWGRATTGGDAVAAASVAAEATAIGDALSDVNGETLVRDTAARVFGTSGAIRRKIALAHEQFGTALRLYGDRDITATERQLDQIEGAFRDLSDPFVERVTVLRASIAYYKNDYAGADAIISSLVDAPGFQMHHKSLHAHALWVRGSSRAARAMPFEAVADHRAALTDYTTLGEMQKVAAVQARLPADYDLAGDPDAAWSERIATFATLSQLQDSVDFLQLLLDSARVAMRQSENYAARALLDAELALCTDTRRIDLRVLRIRALLWRAELLDLFNEKAAARAERTESIALARSIPADEIRFFTMTSVDFLRARFADGIGADIGEIEDATQYARAHQHHSRIPDLLVAKAKAHVARGEVAAAHVAIEEAVADLDLQRSLITSFDGRAAFINSKRSVYAEAIGLALSAGDKEHAFRLLERNHACALGDDFNAASATGEGISTADVARLLPPAVAVVEFGVIADRLLIWLIRHGSVHFYERSLRDGEMAVAVRSFMGAIRSSNTLPGGGQLYELAVAPWLPEIGDARSVVFVPDGDLLDVPFSALSARPMTGCLLERFNVATAPSSTFLISREVRHSAASGRLAVLVASPGAGDDSDLSKLEGAAEEARQVNAMYRQTMLLDGKSATKVRFLAAASTATIIHFAGHAVPNTKMPALSALVLRESDGRTAFLYAHEIAAMKLRDAKVVVLSACATAHSARRFDGFSSLSRAFMAGGAHTVIGSSWPADDVPTEHLAVQLHNRLRAGEPPAVALRAVQLAAIGHVPPRDWAVFSVSGDISSV
jgi:CHAT domain/Putative zinc-finger